MSNIQWKNNKNNALATSSWLFASHPVSVWKQGHSPNLVRFQSRNGHAIFTWIFEIATRKTLNFTLFQNHPQRYTRTLTFHDNRTLPKCWKMLTRVRFELAPSGHRSAALPVELSSPQGLEASFIQFNCTGYSCDNLTLNPLSLRTR